jgi:hypothetical protein
MNVNVNKKDKIQRPIKGRFVWCCLFYMRGKTNISWCYFLKRQQKENVGIYLFRSIKN